jgi:hypothetical protein
MDSMSAPIPLKMVGGTQFARYPKITSETTLNFMVSGSDVDNPSLVPFAGHQKKITFPNGEARGLFKGKHLDKMVAVFGSGVYVITKQLNFRLIGNLNTTSGIVHIAENFGGQVALEDGLHIYIYDYNLNSFTIPAIDFRPIYLTFKDTFFIATDDNDNFHRSDSNDGSLWDVLDINQLQTQGDVLQAAVAFDPRLWVIGENIAEVWDARPTELQVYQRDNSISISYGTVSRDTIAIGFDMLIYLAKGEKGTPQLVVSRGGKPEPISTGGLDFIFSTFEHPEDSVGFLYQIDGHIIYQLTFNSDNFSIAYDFNTNLIYVLVDEHYNRHIAKLLVEFNNKIYFISFVDSCLYEMNTLFTTYDGAIVPRVRIPPNLRQPTDMPFITKKVELPMEHGNSNEVHRIDLSLSKDGGVSFGNTVSRYLQPQGYRKGRVTFRKLGRANDLVTKFTFWSADRFIIFNGTLELSE